MKKLLNTLYVTTQGIYLRQEGETVVVEKERKVALRLPIHTLSGIVCFGNVMCSPYLLGLCGERGVHVSFLSEHGKFLTRIEGAASGNVLLRVAQINAAQNSEKVTAIAKSFVIGKILNSRTILMRRVRDHGETQALSAAITRLANIVLRLQVASDVASVRGLEGEAASVYFDVFNELLVSQKDKFSIQTRNRRPPLDPTNAMLSFLYTMLAHECEGALKSVGLDAQVGFLHALRPGRISLALDLMEEFRSIIVDRLTVSLINLNQVSPKGFKTTESGAVQMTDDTRKTIIDAWQKKKKETIMHPFFKEKVEIGLLPYTQALLLARYLRGDMDAYPPFILK